MLRYQFNTKGHKENCRRGVAVVEAALVLPMLLLVTFGGIRYGWFFLKAQQITNAVRYGARVAIRADASTEDVLNSISSLLGPSGANIIKSGESPSVSFKVNGTVSSGIASASEVGDTITVTIKVPAKDVDILPMKLFDFEPDDWNLSASFTMAKEGF